jgi:hypothetical protein
MTVLNESALQLRGFDPGPRPERDIVLPSPTVRTRQVVFAEAILEEASGHRARRILESAVSLVIHAAVLVALVLVPLFFSKGIDLYQFNRTFLVAPVPPPAAPPPPPPHAIRAVPKQALVPAKVTVPSVIPRRVVTALSDAAPPEEPFAGVTSGVPGGMGSVLGGAPSDLPPPPPIASEGPKRPVRIGGDMRAPRLTYGPSPVYPALAKLSHVFGTVVIEAIIDEHGNVTEVRAVSGPALLLAAALKSVSQRKYEPTILDGEPTPVELRVEVKFHSDG